MDLLPPPGAVADELSRLREEIGAIETRLADNSLAPAEWRAGDERRLVLLNAQIAELTGEPEQGPA